jgi:hypothetical protein
MMLDFETFGTKPGSMIRSIAAVMFTPNVPGTGNEFYMNVDVESQKTVGLTQDPDTVRWWSQQGEAAKAVLEKDQKPITLVLSSFHAWYRANHVKAVWAQGSNFDPVIWEGVCRALGQTTPWKFWETRDTRTAYDLGHFNPKSERFIGVPHYALDDCKHQIKCVQLAVSKLFQPAAAIKADLMEQQGQ